MSNISDFNAASNAETDGEHEIQLGLLQTLCVAVRDGRDIASVAQLLEQLLSYSEAHFMSEELLMRMKSYDDYEAHVDDHVRMLELLHEIAMDHAAGRSILAADKVDSVLSFIGQHIDNRDRRFAAFVRNGL
jgi:hemerythrin